MRVSGYFHVVENCVPTPYFFEFNIRGIRQSVKYPLDFVSFQDFLRRCEFLSGFDPPADRDVWSSFVLEQEIAGIEF